MRLETWRVLEDPPHPVLEMVIDGRVARLAPDQSPSLLRRGIVVLGDEFEDITEAITIPAAVEEGTARTELKGATRDRTVVACYRAFLEYVNR